MTVQGCGTEAAYKRHLRHGEPPCPACLEANNQACQRRRQDSRRLGRPPSGRPRKPQECGTYNAYKAHIIYGEPVGEACRQAARDSGHHHRQRAA